MQSVAQQEILFINFNQSQDKFLLGTEGGYKIFDALNNKILFENYLKGGIGIIDIKKNSNVIALVGGGVQPKFNEHLVIIWDAEKDKCIGEMKFKDSVKNVKITDKYIIIALEKKVFLYEFDTFKQLLSISTYVNPLGICAINQDSTNFIFATPGNELGKVQIYKDHKFDKNIEAHQSQLAYLSLNDNGSLIATASEKGTLIRIFNVETGEIVQEVRRGNNHARIKQLQFYNKWLGCLSEAGTIHIFQLKQNAQETQTKNTKSRFGFLGGVISYYNSEWSFAQFRLNDEDGGFAFENDRTLIAINRKGNYYKINFEEGGEGKVILEKNIGDGQ